MVDLIGLLAGGMVMATFAMRSMLWLRLLALGSNVAFICYGLRVSLWPIWLLHVLLIPLNTYRLAQMMGHRRARPAHQVSRAR